MGIMGSNGIDEWQWELQVVAEDYGQWQEVWAAEGIMNSSRNYKYGQYGE